MGLGWGRMMRRESGDVEAIIRPFCSTIMSIAYCTMKHTLNKADDWNRHASFHKSSIPSIHTPPPPFLSTSLHTINPPQDIRNSRLCTDSQRQDPIFYPAFTFCPFCPPLATKSSAYFRLNEHPSVSLALPPVGWHSTVEQPAQMTTVWACEKTVVMVKQPGHLTSMKKERGAGTRVWRRSEWIVA